MLTFQKIISTLEQYWVDYGCCILQPYTKEVGAGTLHPATVLGVLKPQNSYNIAYVQPSIRPKDGRYGDNPMRMQQHHQFQVILKPAPSNLQQLYLDSLRAIGINFDLHDIIFQEDDWENPSVGASGLGWEIRLDGMEVSQFTYMQQIAGIDLDPIVGELTYGLERICMHVQQIDNVNNIKYNDSGITYGEIFKRNEFEFSSYYLNQADIDIIKKHFEDYANNIPILLQKKLPLIAYDQCLALSHLLNILLARGALGVAQRTNYLAIIRNLVKDTANIWINSYNPSE